MTATTVPRRSLARRRGRLNRAVGDTVAIAGRNLVTIVRLPQLLVFSTIQPVIFVLLFRYAFGGAINTPGLSYVDYLMPGIFAQTVAFGSMGTGVGLAEDLTKGLIERFRSLPMARSAVLAGRILSDLVRNLFVVALMCAVGFAVGFRLHNNLVAFLIALVLLLLFGCALSSMFALVGLSVPSGEAAQAVAFPMLGPLVFASSAFVPIGSMPGWLQAFAKHQPVSVVIDAMRALSQGDAAAGVLSQGASTARYVVQSLVWTAVILAVFGPLAVRRYRRAT
ncbi:MAG: ABC transporter permease [Actinomycetota bacterium]|nr:ABC transporter permease [Actinomycetota bacterium]